MKPAYKLRTDTVRSELGQPVTVYGIEAPSHNISVPDIFTSLPAAEEFVSLCNRLDLSPEHVYEVIDDLL